MKTALFAAAAAMMTFAALPAAAQELYAQGNLGFSAAGQADVEGSFGDLSGSGEVDLENGWLASAALGSGFRGVRVEAEVIYSSNDVDEEGLDASVEHLGLLANVIYDIPMDGNFRPYIGAGVGIGNTQVELEGEDADDTGLAWQVRVGATLGAEEGVQWDVGYRYLNLADFEVSEGDASLEAEADVHAVTVGVRIPLGA